MKKILVVDDSEEIHSLFRVVLEDLKYDLHFAYSGKEAISFLENEKVDLVISDLEMANGCGRWLLKESQKLKHAPKVVIISGDVTASEEGLKEEGAMALFRKPFPLRPFVHYINSIID